MRENETPISDLDTILHDPWLNHLCKFWWRSVKGFRSGGGQILPFPAGFRRRPYNTLALSCECVMFVVLCAYDYVMLCKLIWFSSVADKRWWWGVSLFCLTIRYGAYMRDRPMFSSLSVVVRVCDTTCYSPAVGVRSIAMGVCVCLSVCLFACIFQTATSQNTIVPVHRASRQIGEMLLSPKN